MMQDLERYELYTGENSFTKVKVELIGPIDQSPIWILEMNICDKVYMWNVNVSADDSFDEIKETAFEMAIDFMRKKAAAAKHEYLLAKKFMDGMKAKRESSWTV